VGLSCRVARATPSCRIGTHAMRVLDIVHVKKRPSHGLTIASAQKQRIT